MVGGLSRVVFELEYYAVGAFCVASMIAVAWLFAKIGSIVHHRLVVTMSAAVLLVPMVDAAWQSLRLWRTTVHYQSTVQIETAVMMIVAVFISWALLRVTQQRTVAN